MGDYYEELNNVSDLDGLLRGYKQNKESLDSYKKLCDEGNQLIKDIMKTNNIEKYTSLDGIKATFSIQKRQDFDDEKLLQKIKELGFTDIIKTKEYVDMDGLENLIYNGELDGSAIADCRIIKEVETLRVK